MGNPGGDFGLVGSPKGADTEDSKQKKRYKNTYGKTPLIRDVGCVSTKLHGIFTLFIFSNFKKLNTISLTNIDETFFTHFSYHVDIF